MIPKTPPEKLEQERLQEIANDNSKLSLINSNNIDATQIERATPSDLKAMGVAKLPLLLLSINNKISQIIIPSLKNLVNKEINKYTDSNSCPDPLTLNNITQTRNDIVSQLNGLGRTLNIITVSLTSASSFLNIITNTIKTVKGVAAGISAASKVAPVIPGSVSSGLNDAQTFIRDATFDTKGNSKLAKISSSTGGAALVVSMITVNIKTAVGLISSIDVLIKKCSPNNNSLETLTKEINDISDAQIQADDTQNLTTYNGFIIEIEEIPFTPTVNRRRAIGKNQSGIKLIQSELSFSTNNQTLIDELKFIIERDNLKAY
jgi:hypothetical protein